MKRISVVVACYNEQESLPIFFEEADKVIPSVNKVGYDLSFVLVNDGSKDKTWEVMSDLNEKRDDVTIVNLSKNYGQNPAFFAGINTADGDYVVLMDADLQNPLTLLPDIAKKFNEGYEVVNPLMADRETDTKFKKNTAGGFYHLINKLEGKEIFPVNVNCFRGFSRNVIEEMKKIPEVDKFVLSEVPCVGYKTCFLPYQRAERVAGASKYSLKKMISYALGNISAATSRPLYFPAVIGGILTLLNGVLAIASSVLYFVFMEHNVKLVPLFQWLSIVTIIFLAMSIIMATIGVLGIYLKNVLVNVRGRPTYVIQEVKKSKK